MFAEMYFSGLLMIIILLKAKETQSTQSGIGRPSFLLILLVIYLNPSSFCTIVWS